MRYIDFKNLTDYKTETLVIAWREWDFQHSYAGMQLGINAQVEAITNKLALKKEIQNRLSYACISR